MAFAPKWLKWSSGNDDRLGNTRRDVITLGVALAAILTAVTGFDVNGYFIDEFHLDASRSAAG